MGIDYPGSRGRKRAIALKVADARTLINSALPVVAPLMTAAQLGQVQKVLDAAVVNPAVQREYAELRRKAVYETAGGRAILDQNLYHRSNKLFEEQIVVTEADKRIRLDHVRLLAPDALKPTTDNPDEAAYLAKIRSTLATKGVWLRFTQPLVRIPNDPGGWMIDPRKFEAWLSLGPDGGVFPTKDGRLTRQALLGNTVLGANYYREVYEGSMERALKKALNSIEYQISSGRELHVDWERHRDRAAPLVVPISDALGGADFPSTRMWDAPHKLLVMARQQNVDGNIKDSSQTAIYAAIVTEGATKLLHRYIEDTTAGARRAVKILEILKVAGEIAETVLIVRALVGGLVRVMAAKEAEKSVAATVVKNRSPGAYYPTNYQSPPGAKFRPEFEKTWNVANRTPVSGHGGSAINRMDLATQQKINGWHEDFAARVKDLMAKKGDNLGGWVVSKDELVALDKATSAKWGDIFALYQ